jgi:hypothetical protein
VGDAVCADFGIPAPAVTSHKEAAIHARFVLIHAMHIEQISAYERICL